MMRRPALQLATMESAAVAALEEKTDTQLY